jgi:hypothetical protein
MLLFSFLWLNTVAAPKTQPKPSGKRYSSTATIASSFPPNHAAPETIAAQLAPLQTSPRNKKTTHNSSIIKNQLQEKHKNILNKDQSAPFCSFCCGSNSSSSSNTPDHTAVVIDSFVKPGDHVQETLLDLSTQFPDMFRILEENNLLRREIDDRGFFYKMNDQWAEREAEFSITLDKSLSNSKWFSIAGVVGSLLAMGGSLYLSFGTDLLTGLILGLGSTAISVLTSALDYIKAGTVDYAKRAMETVTSACSVLRNMIPSRFREIITEDEEEAQIDLKKVMDLMQQIKPHEDTDCNSECCNCECDSALGKLYDYFCCEENIDYTQIERTPQAFEALRQKLEENKKWWQSVLTTIRSTSLASGVVAPIFNTVSGALFLTTSLTRQASLEKFNITSTLRNSLDSVDAAFQGTKFANLGISIADFLIKMTLCAIQSKIEKIKIKQDEFYTFVQTLIQQSDNSEESSEELSAKFKQYLQLSGRTGRS